MSRQITIQEGGQPKSLTVDKLQTALVGGGSCLWVPEDETTTTTKHITANGTYRAASDDAYGYSEVTVNVAGGNGSADSHGIPTIEGGTMPGGIGSAVIGKDPETGNDVAVGVDEDGNLVETPVPSYIKVTKPPDKTEYHAGDTINPTGIIVHAYLADGTDFGTVLNSELVYPEPVVPEGSGDQEWTDGDGVNAMLLTMLDDGIGDKPIGIRKDKTPNYDVTLGCGGAGATFYVTQYNGTGYVYQKSGSTGRLNGFSFITRAFVIGNSSMAEMGRWVELWLPADYLPESTKDPRDSTGELTPVGGTADIPVRWKSPYDGREFEDTFEITITGPAPDDDGGNSGGGTTVDDDGFSGGGGTF